MHIKAKPFVLKNTMVNYHQSQLRNLRMTILYHYCSNHAFHSIIESRSIWLSSLSLSNDSMEGKLVADTLSRLAQTDDLDKTATQKLQEAMASIEQLFEGLGLCLSEDGDLLSQWRGYASDASGVSIGFSKDYLEKLKDARNIEDSGFTINKVEYETEAQESLVKPAYLRVKESIEKGAFKTPGRRNLLDARSDEEVERDNSHISDTHLQLTMTLLTLMPKLFLLKTRAFREEREWRLVSPFVKNIDIDDDCSFHPLADRIVPYRKFELLDLQIDPIAEIIIGPKNVTPRYAIDSFLKQSGFPNVKVLNSEATYR